MPRPDRFGGFKVLPADFHLVDLFYRKPVVHISVAGAVNFKGRQFFKIFDGDLYQVSFTGKPFFESGVE